jgi:hypothetical protein
MKQVANEEERLASIKAQSEVLRARLALKDTLEKAESALKQRGVKLITAAAGDHPSTPRRDAAAVEEGAHSRSEESHPVAAANGCSSSEEVQEELSELIADTMTRSHFLIAALHSIYPISTGHDGVTRTICGVRRPKPQTPYFKPRLTCHDEVTRRTKPYS